MDWTFAVGGPPSPRSSGSRESMGSRRSSKSRLPWKRKRKSTPSLADADDGSYWTPDPDPFGETNPWDQEGQRWSQNPIYQQSFTSRRRSPSPALSRSRAGSRSQSPALSRSNRSISPALSRSRAGSRSISRMSVNRSRTPSPSPLRRSPSYVPVPNPQWPSQRSGPLRIYDPPHTIVHRMSPPPTQRGVLTQMPQPQRGVRSYRYSPSPAPRAPRRSDYPAYTPSPPPQMFQFDARSGARPKDRSTRHRFDTPMSGGVWPGNYWIEKVTEQLRLDLVKDGQMVVVVFYSNDCQNCRNICRKIEALAETRPRAKFVRVNVDETPEIVDFIEGLRDDYGITRGNLPFAVSYMDGNFYQSFTGPDMDFELDSLLNMTVPEPGSQHGSTAGMGPRSPRWTSSP